MEQFLNIGKEINISKKRKSDEDYLEELQIIAQKHNGRLISTKWIGSIEKYAFEFEGGEPFFMSANNLKRRGWPNKETYLKTEQDYLKDIELIAQKHDGKLISTEWKGNNKKYQFEFSDGKTFFMTPSNLRRKGWPTNYLGDLEQAALKNNCKLLSTKWIGSQEKYEFELEDGRKFKMVPSQLKYGGLPKDLDLMFKTDEDYLNELQLIAKKNGGKLLSTKWKGADEIYDFETSDGTKFKRGASNLKTSGWPNNIKLFLALSESQYKSNEDFLFEMQKIAEDRGGKLLSKEWLGNNNRYRFIDNNNNIEFECTHSSLLRGQWTPDRGLVSEPICRQVLNHMFNENFIKTKKILTAKLINRKKPLELDGYCEKFKIAFEYQGYPSHWDTKHKSFEETQERDKLKKKFCKKLGILLIEIPKFEGNHKKWDSDNVFNFILEKVMETYINSKKDIPPLNIKNFKIDFTKINHSNEMLSKLKLIAEKNGGKLLSTEWKGSSENYDFEFSDGRRFKAIASRIMSKYGWIKNINQVTKTPQDYIKELNDIAEKNGGKLISKEWAGSSSKYEFEFADGRRFSRVGNKIQQGEWPPDADRYFALQDSYKNRKNKKVKI